MRVLVTKDYDSMSKVAAYYVLGQVSLKADSVLGLATGSTPLGLYKELIEAGKNGVDFSQVKTFNLDEYIGLAPDHPQSYNYYMATNLFDHINISRENVHIPNGMAADVAEECKAYEQSIVAAGGIDLQVLGIGHNAHIGFNEPGTPFGQTTQKIALTDETRQANSRFFDNLDQVPTHAISMGIKSIMRARRIILLASGKDKAEAIHATVCGPVTPDVPASVLQLHPDVTIIVDSGAASLLPENLRASGR